VSEGRLRASIAALAVAGLGIALYLTVTRYTHAAYVCTTGGCEIAQSSRYAELGGVPVALLGAICYLAILGTALVAGEVARALGAALALSGLAFSLYLLYVQLAVIDAICIWCLASDGVMTLLAAATVLRVRAGTRKAILA
jgi:uncharacterized membrane protein